MTVGASGSYVIAVADFGFTDPVDAGSDVSRIGSYETGFVENDGNTAFWWLPNVIGVEPR